MGCLLLDDSQSKAIIGTPFFSMKGQIQFLDPFFRSSSLTVFSNRLPFFHLAPGIREARFSSLFSIPLEPLVQKGMMVFPVKSRLSLKVSSCAAQSPTKLDTLGK